uniref:DUF4360 domain-containing protein n=1 Tax=Globisporangium ultimum (strain ATCC 200006 / CBS 805.95 / DAOM BR144) TaxID=431595 RepID=K3WZ62_GLOUD
MRLGPDNIVAVVLAFMSFFCGLGGAKNASEPVYTIGTLTIAGTGCPPNTVEAVTSSDATGVSVIFSAFQASTDGTRTRQRQSCNIAVPIQAHPGQSIGLFKVDYRGYVYVPNIPEASASFSSEYFFAGQTGIKVKRKFNPGDEQDIFESNSINFQSIIWSPCGGSTNFRINTAIAAVKPVNSHEDVLIMIDSADSTVKGSIQVAVATRECVV